MKVNLYEGFNPIDPESMQFIAWCREFDKIMLENIPEESDFSYVMETGVSLYWEYFIDDESPDDCADVEFSYMGD